MADRTSAPVPPDANGLREVIQRLTETIEHEKRWSVMGREGDVRCTSCDLRYAEREEYGCHWEGNAHRYDDEELAEARTEQAHDADALMVDALAALLAASEAAPTADERACDCQPAPFSEHRPYCSILRPATPPADDASEGRPSEADVEALAEAIATADDSVDMRYCRHVAEVVLASTDLRALLAASEADRATASERGLQRHLYDGEKAAGWDPDDANTLPEEIAHLHEEVSEIFRAWRLTKAATVDVDDNGKPEGVPAECADVAIGLFYIAERWGFDLLDAIQSKHAYNLGRSYATEGRRLHEPATPDAGDLARSDAAPHTGGQS